MTRPAILRDAGQVLLALAALFSVTGLWSAGRYAPAVDFYQFWVVGRAVGAGQASAIYGDAERAALGEQAFRAAAAAPPDSRLRQGAEFRRVLETYSTPFLYTVFAATGGLDYETAYTLFQIVSLACVVSSLLALGRWAGGSVPFALVALVVVAAWFAAVRSELRVANVNFLQLGALTAPLILLRPPASVAREVASGALLGLSVAFKPNLLFAAVLLVALWLAEGRTARAARVAAGCCGSAAAAVALSSAFFGTLGIWSDWLIALRTMPAEVAPLAAGNFAIVAALREGFGIDLGAAASLGLAALAAGALWRGRSRRRVERGAEAASDPLRELGAVGAGCLVYLLTAPLVWLHYYMLTLPALLYVLRAQVPGEERPLLRRWGPGALATIAIALEPLKNVFDLTAYPRMALLGAGSVLLLGLVLRDLARHDAGARVPAEGLAG